MAKVFVSYSHRDGKDEVMTSLRPLERQGLLSLWADDRIARGGDWQREIETALAEATAAVLLISPHFLDSEFITRHELPILLARAEAGRLNLLPVFLRSSLAETLEIPFTDLTTGEIRRVKLSKYQGFGTPGRPLSDRRRAERDRIYTDLAKHLAQVSPPAPAHPPTSVHSAGTVVSASAVPRRAPRRSADPAREYELTVYLGRSGDLVRVRTSRPGHEPLAEVSRRWAEVGRAAEEIARTLDTANRRVLERQVADAATGWGAALFHLLFGPAAEWQPVLRELFGRAPTDPQPTPVFAAVRLRVCTADRLLASLPWRLTSWSGRRLTESGWEFLSTEVEEPGEDRTTTAPAEVLIVAPGSAGDAGPGRAVREVLEKVWPAGREQGAVRTVATRAGLENALRGLRPHLVWWTGRGGVTAGRPGLWLDGPEPLALAQLHDLFRRTGHQPDAVWLDADGLAEPDLPAPWELLPGVPLLVWRRLPEAGGDSAALGLAWLEGWLGGGLDPVAALHQAAGEKPGLDAATLAAHARYRRWTTHTFRTARRQYEPLLSLDRDKQKALVRKHVQELVDSDTRRVLGLVASAATGNHVDRFWEQLRHDLEGALFDRVDVTWKRLQFPADRRALLRDLEAELRLQLGAEEGEPLKQLLRRQIPPGGRDGRRPVLWLDWGTFGASHGQAPLLPSQLADWLCFASETLSRGPEDLRLVVFGTLESDNQAAIFRAFQDIQRQPWCRRPEFRLTPLEPLQHVEEIDLLYHLEDLRSSSCPPALQTEIAERIHRQTGGRFDQTVQLLEEAEKGSWYALLDRLRDEQGASPAHEETPL